MNNVALLMGFDYYSHSQTFFQLLDLQHGQLSDKIYKLWKSAASSFWNQVNVSAVKRNCSFGKFSARALGDRLTTMVTSGTKGFLSQSHSKLLSRNFLQRDIYQCTNFILCLLCSTVKYSILYYSYSANTNSVACEDSRNRAGVRTFSAECVADVGTTNGENELSSAVLLRSGSVLVFGEWWRQREGGRKTTRISNSGRCWRKRRTKRRGVFVQPF